MPAWWNLLGVQVYNYPTQSPCSHSRSTVLRPILTCTLRQLCLDFMRLRGHVAWETHVSRIMLSTCVTFCQTAPGKALLC